MRPGLPLHMLFHQLLLAFVSSPALHSGGLHKSIFAGAASFFVGPGGPHALLFLVNLGGLTLVPFRKGLLLACLPVSGCHLVSLWPPESSTLPCSLRRRGRPPSCGNYLPPLPPLFLRFRTLLFRCGSSVLTSLFMPKLFVGMPLRCSAFRPFQFIQSSSLCQA